MLSIQLNWTDATKLFISSVKTHSSFTTSINSKKKKTKNTKRNIFYFNSPLSFFCVCCSFYLVFIDVSSNFFRNSWKNYLIYTRKQNFFFSYFFHSAIFIVLKIDFLSLFRLVVWKSKLRLCPLHIDFQSSF